MPGGSLPHMTLRKTEGGANAGRRGRTADRRESRDRRDVADETLLISLLIDTRHLKTARQVLHRALGDDMAIYVATIDNRGGRASLQIELAAERVPRIMSLVMSALPEAEFGAIRPSRRSRPH